MNFKAKVVRTVAAAGLTIAMTTGVAFASIGSATVTADSLRLRSEANTGSATLTQAPYGTKVTVEENAGNGWYKVTYGSKTGYMSGEYLNITLNDGTVIQDQAIPTAAAPQQLRGLVSTDVLNVRAGAGTSFDKVGSLRGGAVVDIVADAGNGWYQISSGYVSAQYITLVDANYQASASNALGDSAAAMARQLVGSRYAYGGTGPYGFDCSGLIYYIYRQLGHPVARGASSQYYNSGYFVSVSAMQPGDLIFFFDRNYDSSGGTLPVTHVGIYVGNGQFVHASSPSSGVRYDSVYSGYHASHSVGAKRIG